MKKKKRKEKNKTYFLEVNDQNDCVYNKSLNQ